MLHHFLEYGRPLKLNMEYINLLELFKDIEKIIKTKTDDLNIKIYLILMKILIFLGIKKN